MRSIPIRSPPPIAFAARCSSSTSGRTSQSNGRVEVDRPDREDMRRFGVSEDDLDRAEATPALRELLRFQVERTRRMLYQGASLGQRLKGRIGLELRLVIAGGDTILEKILAARCDVFRNRPVLRPWDWAAMLLHALSGDGRIAARYAT